MNKINNYWQNADISKNNIFQNKLFHFMKGKHTEISLDILTSNSSSAPSDWNSRNFAFKYTTAWDRTLAIDATAIFYKKLQNGL